MAEQSGYQIGSRFYPLSTSFRLGDPVLVEQLTGLAWSEFLERLPEDEDPDGALDPVAELGLIGVAIAQANPLWRRDKVVSYTTRIERDKITFVGPEAEDDEDDEAEGDARPPDKAGETTSSSSPPTSRSDSDSPSELSTPVTSGESTSPS
jgi:hypothetical protein